MVNLATNALINISEFLNDSNYVQSDFYEKVIERLKSSVKADYYGVYFLDIDKFENKVSSNKKTSIKLDEKFYDYFMQTKDITFCVDNKELKTSHNNIVCSKLHIRNTYYGVILIARDTEFNQEELVTLEALTSIVSYLVKDFELNDVFKMQLKALQEAIIEKNHAYDVIKKQHKKLLELDKTKNAFLANISHELRTPLNAIIGFSQALGQKIFGELNEKQEEYINDIQVSSLHLLGMINEILDISKIEAKAMKISLSEVSPKILTQEVINILTPLAAQKELKINFNSKCDKNIMADYQKLQQILYNLVSNAIKFTPEKGNININISKKGKDFILQVQDSGIGIEKKYHNKIFSKFVHLDNIYTKSQSSTGLGLTITKELVKLHKGKITLQSAPNEGSTFTVTLNGAIL